MLLRNVLKPVLSCTGASGLTAQQCLDCARDTAASLRHGWLRAIGAPDYRAYLAHHAATHPGGPPLKERDYVNMFMERRFGRGNGRCC